MTMVSPAFGGVLLMIWGVIVVTSLPKIITARSDLFPPS